MLFFDVRERKLMGGFFESHTEDVTDVKFHPTNPDQMATGRLKYNFHSSEATYFLKLILGSTDGLINVFDISKEDEDDALSYSLNTESSVAKIKWHVNEENQKISCITNTNNLMLFDATSQDLLKDWSRETITESIKRKSVIDCNLIDCYNIGESMITLATSNYNKGECLRSLKFNDKKLKPLGNFAGNKQILRASVYQEQDDIFYTFGEAGIISVWKEGETDESSEQAQAKSNLKEDSNVKKSLKKKTNPY